MDKNIKLKKYWTEGDAMRIFFSCLLTFLVVSLLPYFFVDDALANDAVFGWIVSGLASLSLGAAVFVFSKINGVDFASAEKFNKKIDLKQLFIGLGIIVGLMICMLPVVNLFENFIVKLGFPEPKGTTIGSSPIEIILAVLVACVIAGATEEIFMRGALCSGLSGMGKIGASALSGFAFMLFHMNPASTVYQFVLGFVLGYIYLSCANIWVPIILHFFNNALSILLSFTVPEDVGNLLFIRFGYVSFIIGAAAVVGLGYLFIKKTDDRFEAFLTDGNEEIERVKPTKGEIFAFALALVVCTTMWLFRLVQGV